MCGIVGYIGNHPAAAILVAGLKRLEYRGYDSAGLALHAGATGTPLTLCKRAGRIRNLESALSATPGFLSAIPATIAMQLLAYHIADLRGCPIDKPRNLAKSVTVE